MFRTDKQGAVTVYSDGANYWFSTDPCQDWSSPTVNESSSDGASDSGSTDSGTVDNGSTDSGSAASNGTDTAGSDDAGTGASQGAGATNGAVTSGSQETEGGGTPTGTTPAENTPAESTPAENTQEYVLNTNTMVFHYPWCSSVNRMKDSNKVFVNDTRDNIINQGYKPCGRCYP